MSQGQFAARTLIVQFPDGTKKSIKFTIGPIMFNSKMSNYACSISCTEDVFENTKIAGVDEIDALCNSIVFMESMIKEKCREAKFFWVDGSEYNISFGSV